MRMRRLTAKVATKIYLGMHRLSLREFWEILRRKSQLQQQHRRCLWSVKRVTRERKMVQKRKLRARAKRRRRARPRHAACLCGHSDLNWQASGQSAKAGYDRNPFTFIDGSSMGQPHPSNSPPFIDKARPSPNSHYY